MTYMGWLDKTDDPLPLRVRRAMEYHQKKYGLPPNIVELPLNERGSVELNIEVSHYNHILPYHMLLGVKTEKQDGHIAESQNVS